MLNRQNDQNDPSQLQQIGYYLCVNCEKNLAMTDSQLKSLLLIPVLKAKTLRLN
ncbi:asr1801 [Nostoc sp. PCC 7120 = FACHB-418]|nr:asr1801 [Nostoc sp. PCC 7120 = FACHB-418]